MCSRVSRSIPVPVSLTASCTYDPGAASKCSVASWASKAAVCVVIVIEPPLGMASRALTTRLTRIWSILHGSAGRFKIEEPLPRHLAAAEGEELERQRGRAIGRAGDRIDGRRGRVEI